jgi:IMP cyclohydrolase-like protein
VTSLKDLLSARPYPGRGLAVAKTSRGALQVVYFVTGRSDASRGRAIAVLPNGDAAVQDTASRGGHDALRHYVAAARRQNWLVVGNGDQVVPIAEDLAGGASITAAWSRHSYEPDPPIHTSRIWAAFEMSSSDSDCTIGFASRSSRGGGECDRVAWSIGFLPAGSGALMTTYRGTPDDIVSTRHPDSFGTTAETGEDLLRGVWDALPSTLRVAALVLDVSLAPRRTQTVHERGVSGVS